MPRRTSRHVINSSALPNPKSAINRASGHTRGPIKVETSAELGNCSVGIKLASASNTTANAKRVILACMINPEGNVVGPA